jgi:hypothetical protein
MKKYENGTYRDMTPEEIKTMQEEQAKAEAEEKKRPLTESEVSRMLITAQINTISVDDQTALRMREFYPEWESGKEYAAGYKVQYGGQLYKVITAHTSQADWTPDAVASLYTRIDETHDGTKYDPIPYSGNMALEEGKYYTEGGVLYLCTRDTVNPVYNALRDLVGVYVEITE